MRLFVCVLAAALLAGCEEGSDQGADHEARQATVTGERDEPGGVGAVEAAGHETRGKAKTKQHEAGQATALHLAALEGRLAEARKLVSQGADVNATAGWGRTPLHEAAAGGHLDVARMLLDHGAAVDAGTGQGLTPLGTAVLEGRLQMAELLLSKEADPNHELIRGKTLLHVASTPATARLLMAKGLEVTARDRDGNTPLHTAHTVEMVDFLLAKGLKIGARSKEGDTPLHVAASAGREQVVARLLDRGAGIDARDRQGRVPLHMAVITGEAETAGLLLARGAGVDLRDKNGHTPMHLSIMRKNRRMIELLLDKGADPALANKQGMSPLHLAVVGSDDLEIIELLIEHGADVNARARSGMTPLHLVSKAVVARALIRHGADPRAENAYGHTALDAMDAALRTEIERDLAAGGKSGKTPARKRSAGIPQAGDETVQMDAWWKAGDAACPGVGGIEGAPPPEGTGVWCACAGGRHGPYSAWWPHNKKTAYRGAYRFNQRHGRWITWDAQGVVLRVERYEEDVLVETISSREGEAFPLYPGPWLTTAEKRRMRKRCAGTKRPGE